MATSLDMIFIGVAMCGLQMAITQSIFMAMITDSVPEDLRGTGFGVYYLICAVSVIISNAGAGFIAEAFSESVSFLVSMVVAILALLCLFAYSSFEKSHQSQLLDR
jgi:MFS family permease